VKLSDPGATALIGAGAALAGVLLSSAVTFVIDSRRRRWEDQRRWDETRQRSYASFHYTARQAIGAAGRLGAMATRMAKQQRISRQRGVAATSYRRKILC